MSGDNAHPPLGKAAHQAAWEALPWYGRLWSRVYWPTLRLVFPGLYMQQMEVHYRRWKGYLW